MVTCASEGVGRKIMDDAYNRNDSQGADCVDSRIIVAPENHGNERCAEEQYRSCGDAVSDSRNRDCARYL